MLRISAPANNVFLEQIYSEIFVENTENYILVGTNFFSETVYTLKMPKSV